MAEGRKKERKEGDLRVRRRVVHWKLEVAVVQYEVLQAVRIVQDKKIK